MTDGETPPRLIERLRNMWTGFGEMGTAVDYSMQEYLLDRIRNLEQAISRMRSEIDELRAGERRRTLDCAAPPAHRCQ